MFPATLYPKTAQVLKKLSEQAYLADFYLAGGTALALQLGHRKSIDLDFFIDTFPKQQLLLSQLAEFSPKIIQEAPGTVDTIIDDVKVTFLEYPYHTLEMGPIYEKVRLASVIDIACMKISAISSRGVKKDFIDLYFILQTMPLNELLLRFEAKYSSVKYSEMHIMKSLTYFTDADNDPDPDMLQTISWEEVKGFLVKNTQRFLS